MFPVVALAVAAMLGGAVVGTASAQEAGNVSKGVAKTLKAAQDAEAAKNYDDALAKLREAQAVPDKNAYDTFVINELSMFAYAKKNDAENAAKSMEANLDSPYLAPGAKLPRLKQLMGIYYGLKDYDKAVSYGQRAQKEGDTSDETQTLIGQALYLQGKCKDLLPGLQSMVSQQEKAGKKPTEGSLQLLFQCYDKGGQNADAGKTIDTLLEYYGKSDKASGYWQNALASLDKVKDDDNGHLKLNIYRLKNEIGILKVGGSYTDMAEIALEQGNPAEAQSVLEVATAKNLFPEGLDKQRAQRLLDASKKKAVERHGELAKDERDADKDPSGDALVAVGEAYATYGEYPKAVDLMTRGVSKGNLKSADEAYLLLGVAYLRQKNTAEAERTLAKIKDGTPYDRLGKLWLMRLKA
jgi:Tetratricopeptide repeat